MPHSTPEKLIEDAEKLIDGILEKCDKLTSGNVTKLCK